MRILFCAVFVFLTACSQDGGFHASRSMAPTDPTITPERPLTIQPRGENARPHVLGYLEVKDGKLELQKDRGMLTFKALLELKRSSTQRVWAKQIELQGQIDVNGQARLFPVGGDDPNDLPARARVTCLSDYSPSDCDQAIIDVFVREGDRTHAAQILADLRTQTPPESFAPSEPSEPRAEKSEEAPVPVNPAPPSSGETTEESDEDVVYPPSGPRTRQALGPAKKRRQEEERRRAEALQERMNPPASPENPALREALERKAEEERKRLAAAPRTTPKTDRLPRKTEEERRAEALHERMNPPATPDNPALREALERKAQEERERRERAATPVAPPPTEQKPAPVPTAPAPEVIEPPAATVTPTPRPPESATPVQPTPVEEEEEEEMEEEGEDPEERPSLFIGTLHDSSDDLFEQDRPVELPLDKVPVPTPRPEPEKPEVRTPSPAPAPPVPSPSASRPRDQVIGGTSSGRLERASDLRQKNSPGFRLIHSQRARHYGSHELVEVIAYLAKYASSQPRIGTLRVGDLSVKNGGKIPNSRHRSHQNGLDVDLGYPVNTALAASGFLKLVDSGGRINPGLRVPETWALIKAAWNTNSLDRVFVDAKIKRALCEHAKSKGELASNGTGSAAELLRRLRPTPGHATHWHLRLKCSKEQPRCRQMGEPPRGSGC